MISVRCSLSILLTSSSSKLISEPYADLAKTKRPAFTIWALKKRSLRAISPHLLIYIRKVYRIEKMGEQEIIFIVWHSFIKDILPKSEVEDETKGLSMIIYGCVQVCVEISGELF